MSLYRGRFAPSPTGPLHFGSMVNAVVSFLDAHVHNGAWMLRFDDLDRGRCKPEYESRILRQLESSGLVWDGVPRRQKDHIEAYQDFAKELWSEGHIYACACSRKDLLARTQTRGVDGALVYDRFCREKNLSAAGHAWRFRAGACSVFQDRILGAYAFDPEQDLGDFVVRRSDGVVAYHLADVVDELAMDISHVVRGNDLLGSTARQMQIWESVSRLRRRAPEWAHIGLILNADGNKLSKQRGTSEFVVSSESIASVLAAIGLRLPSDLDGAPVTTLIDWAKGIWKAGAIMRVRDQVAADETHSP